MEIRILLVVIGVFFAALFGITILTLMLSRKEFKQDKGLLLSDEMKGVEPYSSLQAGLRESSVQNLNLVVYFIVYYVIAVPVVVKVYGVVMFGPQRPYAVFLAVTGIPLLILLVQLLIMAERQRLRLHASGADKKYLSLYNVGWIISALVFFAGLLIPALLDLSRRLL